MKLAKSIHQTAMEYMMYAEMAKAKGQPLEAKEAYVIAFLLEKNAAARVGKDDIESKTTLMRSAAALAYHASLYEESKSLITQCLAENPSQDIIKELEEIANLIKEATKTNAILKTLQLEGVLTDINTKEHEITLNNLANQQVFSIFIPSSLFKEIVQEFWTKKVQIQASVTAQGRMVLEEIRMAA